MDLDVPILAPTPFLSGRSLALAVDDNDDNLMLLLYALDLFGFRHISTTKGQEVLELAIIHQPDVILLDVILPDISGIDVIQSLRQTPETQALPIIAVTAMASPQDRERLIGIGCMNCVSKPYDVEALEIMLRPYLQPSQLAF